MEKFRTNTEVKQRVKERENIVEDTEGSLPATNQFWKLANTSSVTLLQKDSLF